MKLYKDYTKERYSFLAKNITLSWDNPYDLERTYYKICISEKTKTIDNKIEQNQAQYNLDRKSAKISANVSKYKFLNGEDALPENELLEKDATVKIFEYSPLGIELKAQTDIAKN